MFPVGEWVWASYKRAGWHHATIERDIETGYVVSWHDGDLLDKSKESRRCGHGHKTNRNPKSGLRQTKDRNDGGLWKSRFSSQKKKSVDF